MNKRQIVTPFQGFKTNGERGDSKKCGTCSQEECVIFFVANSLHIRVYALKKYCVGVTRIRRSVDTPFVLLSTASTWGTHHNTHRFSHDFPNEIASPFRLRAAFAWKQSSIHIRSNWNKYTYYEHPPQPLLRNHGHTKPLFVTYQPSNWCLSLDHSAYSWHGTNRL